MTAPGLAVGVLADTKSQLSELSRMLGAAGYRVVASVEHSPRAADEPLPPAQVWLVQLDMDCEHAQQRLSELDDAGIPVIFADEDVPAATLSLDAQQLPEALRKERVRRLALKLEQLVPVQQHNHKRAQFVWVLAASTGGPEAVASFLKAIHTAPEGVALLYAQHIDAVGMGHLTRMVQQQSAWQLQSAQSSQPILEKSIYMISPEHTFDIVQPGVLAPSSAPWSGRFKPSLNQVIAKVARVYGAQGGAIVFSGMGDDGAQSCQLLHHLGGQVWVQSLASCTLDSMPKSVTALGCVQKAGSPVELAGHLMAFHRQLQKAQPRAAK